MMQSAAGLWCGLRTQRCCVALERGRGCAKIRHRPSPLLDGWVRRSTEAGACTRRSSLIHLRHMTYHPVPFYFVLLLFNYPSLRSPDSIPF